MVRKTAFLLALAAFSTSAAIADDKYVFAHFIAGNAVHMSQADWATDIALAKDAKIDGFSMNIAAGDPNTDQVLAAAYAAAETHGSFHMFLSFDYLSIGVWEADRVIDKVNSYKSSPAQFHYRGRPLVSTFEGAGNVKDWAGIKAETDCFVVPDWSSLGPGGFAAQLDVVDGAFSWDAWPDGARRKGIEADEAWMKMLGGRPFMMPVSPWFYTNLPNWGKNWLWRGDDLWHDRWQDAALLQPAMVQIISWNDFGEAHYIGPIHESGIPDGADYVHGMPHAAWMKFLPIYIDAYKGGNSSWTKDRQEAITYWYKVNPGQSGSTGGTMGNNPGHGQQVLPAHVVSEDRIFVSVLVALPSEVTVTIGKGRGERLRATSVGINHFSVPLDGRTGPVQIKVVREGREIASARGPAITDQCKDGLVNWNAYVGSS